MLTRDYLRAVERALFDYPSLKKQLVGRERWIECRCRGGGEPVEVGKSSVRPVHRYQETVVEAKERDYTFMILSAKIQAINDAIDYLPDVMKDLVEMYYFRDMSRVEVMCELNISEREFFRQRRRIVERVAPYVVGPFGMGDND